MTTVFIISAPSGSGKIDPCVPPAERGRRPDVLGFLHHEEAARQRSGRRSLPFHRPRRVRAPHRRRRISRTRRGFRQLLRHTSGRAGRSPRSSGKDLVLDIDVQGAAQLKKRIPDAVSIFILAAVAGGSGAAPAGAEPGQGRSDSAAVGGCGPGDSELQPVRLRAGEQRSGPRGGNAEGDRAGPSACGASASKRRSGRFWPHSDRTLGV